MNRQFHAILFSYLLLAAGQWVGDGSPILSAQLLSGLGILTLLFAFFSGVLNKKTGPTEFRIIPSLVIAVVFVAALMLFRKPGYNLSPDSDLRRFSPFVYLLAAILPIPILGRRHPALIRLFFGLVLALFVVSSIWKIRETPAPVMDVWTTQQGAAKALILGKNPYSLRFEKPPESPGIIHDDRYVYPPYALLVTAPFYIFWKDIRFANLFCQALAGLLLYLICRRVNKSESAAALLATLFLFYPRWHFVLEQAWTESTCLVLIFASVYFLLRKRNGLGHFFVGVTLTAKQFLPPLGLLYYRFFPAKPRWLILSIGVAAVPCLFFLFWDPHAFYDRVIYFHMSRPPRLDALSVNSIFLSHFGFNIPAWLPFVMLGAIFLIGWKITEVYGFALTAAAGFVVFFCFNKIAFINYYFLVGGLQVLALALLPQIEPVESPAASAKKQAPPIASPDARSPRKPRRTSFAMVYLLLLNALVLSGLFLSRYNHDEIAQMINERDSGLGKLTIVEKIRLYFSHHQDLIIYYQYSNKILGFPEDRDQPDILSEGGFILNHVILNRPYSAPAARYREQVIPRKLFEGRYGEFRGQLDLSEPTSSAHLSKFSIVNWDVVFSPIAGQIEKLGLAGPAAGAAEVRVGKFPYRDFNIEYPPLSILPMLYAGMVSHDFNSFALAFSILASLAAYGSLFFCYLIFKRVYSECPRITLNDFLLFSFLSLLAIGLVFPTRLDIFPAFLSAAGLYCLISSRYISSSILLTLATMTKLYPAIFLPILGLTLIVRKEYRILFLSVLASLLILLAINLPFLISSGGAYLQSYSYHMKRPSEVGSFYANAMFLQKILFGIPAKVVNSFGSANVISKYEPVYAALQKFLPIAAFGTLYLLFVLTAPKCSPENQRKLQINFFVLLILAFLITCKVFSPQYVIWLFPVIFLVDSYRVRFISFVYIAACFLSQIIYPKYFHNLVNFDRAAIWLLTMRNVMVLVIFAVLLWDTMRPKERISEMGKMR